MEELPLLTGNKTDICTHNVTTWNVCLTIVDMEKQRYFPILLSLVYM